MYFVSELSPGNYTVRLKKNRKIGLSQYLNTTKKTEDKSKILKLILTCVAEHGSLKRREIEIEIGNNF